MSFKKYILYFVVLSITSFLGFFVYQNFVGPKKYDFYDVKDENNCNSPYQEKPYMTASFIYKKETGEIFITVEELDRDNTIHRDIQVLRRCSVFDARNWKCGGDWTPGSSKSATMTMVNGEFFYQDAYTIGVKSCPVKVEQK